MICYQGLKNISDAHSVNNHEGMSSFMASDDSSFYHNSASQGAAFFLPQLGSTYFNCSSRRIEASHLAASKHIQELCPSGNWSDNYVTSGYGYDLATPPASMNVSAPSFGNYISDYSPAPPISVRVVDQLGRPILTGDEPLVPHCVTSYSTVAWSLTADRLSVSEHICSTCQSAAQG